MNKLMIGKTILGNFFLTKNRLNIQNHKRAAVVGRSHMWLRSRRFSTYECII